MKRLLSLILAITMIAAFIPAVSAVATADATKDIKIVYDLGYFDAADTAVIKTTAFPKMTYAVTHGFWAYAMTNLNDTRCRYDGDTTKAFQWKNAGYWVAFEINVPETGTYDLAATYRQVNTTKNIVDVYMCEPVTSNYSGQINEGNRVGTISGGEKNVDTTATICKGKFLSAGKHFVYFNISTADQWFALSKIILTSGEGKTAPFVKEYTAPASEVAVGASSAMNLVVSDALSDGRTDAGVITVTYSSSNDKIAKVDASGNITGVADGTATITAKVSAANSDNYVTKTAEVKVGTGVYLDPNEITVMYNLVVPADVTEQYYSNWYKTDTKGFITGSYANASENKYNSCIRIQRKSGSTGITGRVFMIDVNVPKTGDYDIIADWEAVNGRVGFDFFIYQYEGSGGLEYANNLPDEEAVAKFDASSVKARTTEKVNTEKVHLEAGNYHMLFRVYSDWVVNGMKESHNIADGWLVPYSISLVAGSGNALMGGAISGVADALEIDETATASAVAYLSKDASVAGNFTFTSSDPSVLEVSATGAVKALSAGKAEIIATSADAVEGNNEIRKAVTVNAPPAPEAPKAPKVTLLVAGSASGADVDVTVDGASASANAVLSENRGANVTVVANELTGYTFRGWVRGSRDSGVWVSSDVEYSFVAMTNTMLTAIYEENIDGNAVEYYNENGEYIATKAVTEDAPSAPALAGYSFLRWLVGEDKALDLAAIKAPLTRAVAEHTAKASAGLVKVDNVAQEETAFNAPIALSATKEGFTAWKRDGKVVSYSKDYTYYIWSSTDIEEFTEAVGEKLPIVVLDADKVDGSWMVEYDSAGYQIAEVGIIFGDDENITIESCKTKRNSQRNSAHGQFAASSDCDAAVGYIIYKDNGEYKVIYSK